MKKAILATKIGMTQIFNADGVLVPVTVLEAGPCVVTQIKTVENDGYSAVQVGFGDKKEKVVEKDANGKKSVAHRHGVINSIKTCFYSLIIFSDMYRLVQKFQHFLDVCLQP